MENNLFDLDIQVKKSSDKFEPQVLSIWRCSGGCSDDGRTSATCVATAGKNCFTNIGSIC